MSKWRKYKLGELIDTNQDNIDKKFPYDKIKYLDTGSITEGNIERYEEVSLTNAPSRAKRLVKNEDIIFSTVRPNQKHYGFVTNPPKNLVVSTGFVVISCKKNILFPKYLYYKLISKETVEYLHVVAEASTSTYPSLKPIDIENLKIEIPPLPEQKAIAGVLSSIDDKIDLLHRQNKTLEEMAETIFSEWFTKPSPNLSQRERDMREGWSQGVIPDEFDFTMGLSPKGNTYNEEGMGIPLFQGNADFEFRFPKNRVYTTDPKRYAYKYDTLISVRAPVGVQNMAKEKCCIGRGVAAFRYKKNNSFYTYTYFKIKSLMEEIKQFNETGTVFGSITKSDFESFEIEIPPNELVEKFQKEVKPIDDRIISNCSQSRTLEKLRDTLLPKLMSGEVRLRISEQDLGD